MAIVAGLLASTMTALVVSARQEESLRFEPIEIPVSGDRDEFEYHSSGSAEDVGTDGSVEAYDWDSRFAARFVGQKTVPDRTGIMHEAIEFLYLQIGDWREDDGTLVHPDGSTRGARGLLDVTTKTYIAHEEGSSMSYDWEGSRDTSFRPLVRWQGLRIEPGMTLPSDPFLAYRYGNLIGYGSPQTAEESCTADRAGFLGDEPVVGIRCIMVTRAFAEDGSVAWEDRTEETSWVADGHAYPLRMDYDWTGSTPNESYRGQGAFVLVRLEKGGEPVEWDSCDDLDHFPYHRPDLERTQGRSPPSTGSESVLPYPMEQAMASVASDPTLVDYQSWQDEHPTTFLIAAMYARLTEGEGGGTDDATPESHQWQFVHWADDGTAFRVETTLLPDGQVVNRDRTCAVVFSRPFASWTSCGYAVPMGEFRLPLPIDAEPPYPKNPITITAAHELAASVVPADLHKEGIQSLEWGQFVWARNMPDYNGSYFGPHYFNWTVVAYGDEPTGFNAPLGEFGAWYVYINVERGVLTRVTGLHFTPGEPLQFLPTEAPPDEVLVDYAAPPGGPPLQSVVLPAAAAGGATMLLVALFLFLLPRLRDLLVAGLAWIPGYAKLRRHELLDHPLRRRIHRTIRRDPGLNATQIHGAVGGGWSTVVFHLRKLSDASLVTVVRDGRHRRFFLPGHTSPNEMAKLSVLCNPATKSAYEHLRAHPGMSRTRLARRMGMSVPGALWHLERLEENGLATRRTEGRTVLYEPASPK